MYTRYALYFTPPPGVPLADFGAAWLGWDSATASAVPHLDCAGLDLADITKTPRKYGFHATLKPPFRLAQGQTAADLETALDGFATEAKAVTLQGLAPRRLGRFIALCPVGDVAELAQLSARIVEDFDDFRAPPNAAELAKRRKARLTPAQDAMLERWGYPYVQTEFRYHMTLTGPLDDTLHPPVMAALEAALQDIPLQPFTIDALTLLGERSDGTFAQLKRVPLRG